MSNVMMEMKSQVMAVLQPARLKKVSTALGVHQCVIQYAEMI